METILVSADEWMDKGNVVYIHNGISFNLKKKEIPSFATIWINLSGYYANWCKSDTERQIQHGITSMWNLKKNKWIETESRMVAARGWGMRKIGRSCEKGYKMN